MIFLLSDHGQQESSIQNLCKVIESCNLETDSIYDILTETNDAVVRAKGDLSPSFYSTLNKKLFFRPPTTPRKE